MRSHISVLFCSPVGTTAQTVCGVPAAEARGGVKGEIGNSKSDKKNDKRPEKGQLETRRKTAAFPAGKREPQHQ